MAEETDSNKEKKKSDLLGSTFHKGLHLDSAPENQPDGTYRFALNSVLESQEGNYFAISNEQSNFDCVTFPNDFVPIGSIYMNDDERVVFLVKRSLVPFVNPPSSAIGIVRGCFFEQLIVDPNLNFQINRPIKGVFRIRNGCERNIYFVDGYNNDRAINLDRLDIYKDEDGNWITSEFNLLRREPDIDISFIGVNEQGGRTKVGTFQLAVRYLDEYNNALPPSQLVGPFNVINAQYGPGTQMFAVDGGLLSDNPVSSKSFRFRFDNVNFELPFLEIIALETSNGTTSAYVVDRIPTQGQSTIEYIYSGTDGSYAYPIEINESVEQGVKETTSIAITQADNRLIRANTSEPVIDWTPFIEATNNTEVKWYIKSSELADSKRPDAPKSFMGDETYALGLRWIIDDYIESPVFHIPGRKAIDDAGLVTVGNGNTHSRPQLVGSTLWDKQELTVSAQNVNPATLGANVVSWEDVQFYKNTVNGIAPIQSQKIERWKVFNTAILQNFTVNGKNYGFEGGAGILAYTESECERYPVILKCGATGNVANDYLYPVETQGNKFIGQKVRHHKMPDRTLVPAQGSILGPLEQGSLLNINLLVMPPVPVEYAGSESRFKLQVVAVPRDKNNSTVIDAGVIALAPFTAARKTESTYDSSPTDVNTATYNDYRGFHIGSSGDPGATANGYGAVTTNYNALMTNIENPTNSRRPSSWYYTHFISPSFTHLSEDFKYSHYKLERMLWGPTIMELTKFSATQPANPGADEFPEFVASLLLTHSSVPGATIPTPGTLKLPERTVFGLKKIDNFPLWTNRNIMYGAQIGYNESLLVSRVASRSVYSDMLPNATTSSSLPKGLTMFGGTLDQKHQKGFIAVCPIDQRIVDPINSWTETTGPTDDETWLFTNNNEGKAVNLLNVFATFDDYDGIKNCVATQGIEGPDRYGWHAYYGTIKNGNRCAYQGLDTLQYRPVSKIVEFNTIQGNVTALEATEGDCFISRFDYVNTINNKEHVRRAGTFWQNPVIKTGSNVLPQKAMISNDIKFIVESPLNINLASSDPENSLLYFPFSNYALGISMLRHYGRYHNGPSPTSRGFQEIAYLYNKDFSKLNNENVYISLPHTFNFCSDCINKNVNRIYYSERSNTEELADFYRVFLTNNYKDLAGETGQIVDITEYNNSILIDTEESRFLQRYGSQQLQTDESNISIGTGDFFGLDADRVAYSDIGFFGNQSRFANIKSEYGIFTVDSRGGRVFLNSQLSPEPISAIGMNSWFRDNLPLNFKSQIEFLIQNNNLNVNFNLFDYDTPQNVLFPIGFIAALDTKFNRIILTKHDWALTDNNEAINGVNQFINGNLSYNNTIPFKGGRWKLGSETVIPSERPDLFENKSWTMSYSLKDKCWVSWHNYLPSFMYGNKLELFSYQQGAPNVQGNYTDILFKHNKFNHFQTFYNKEFPHIIEAVIPSRSYSPVIYDHLQFNTTATQWNPDTKEYLDKRYVTFDKGLFYNDHQCSGLLNLVTKKKSEFFTRQFRNISGEAIIDVNEKVYSVNGFKDMVVNRDVPMFSRRWEDIQSGYYIDKVLNTSSINLQKNWYEREVFRDRYLIARLFFSIFVNIKLTTNLSLFKTTQTIR